MMKTKKSSLLVILAFAMVLALSCSAWAASAAYVDANGVSKTASGDITTNSDDTHGIWARNVGGSIVYTGGTIKTTGTGAHAAFAQLSGKVQGTGTLITTGYNSRGLTSNQSADLTWVGDITTSNDLAYGAWAANGSSIDITGNVVTHGQEGRGIVAYTNGYVNMKGDITTYGETAHAVSAITASSTTVTPGVVNFEGNIVTYGDYAQGVGSRGLSEVYIKGDVTTHGDDANAIDAVDNATVTVTGGTISVLGDGLGYAFSSRTGGTVSADNVTVESERLYLSGSLLGEVDDADGNLNVSNSTLTGDIFHSGNTADTATITLTDTTWSGAVECSGDIGAIDLILEGSTWNVTGDSDTNGKVTADEDSNIDFRGTTDNIVVEIDNLEGDPALNIKIDDTLVIKNSDGTITDISSSNPDVIEIVQDPVTGEITIISKGDGDTEITYTYIDGAGDEQTKTIGVTSGAGSDPAGGGGGSSNCNSGVGAALFALLGLAFVYKKK